jgi:hypothetical protein
MERYTETTANICKNCVFLKIHEFSNSGELGFRCKLNITSRNLSHCPSKFNSNINKSILEKHHQLV